MPKFVPVGQEDPMTTLCRMAAETKYEDLPSNVVTAAKRDILDAMTDIVGGSAMEGIPAIVDYVKDKGGKPQSVIPFYGGKVPAAEAALVLGPMARAMDYGAVPIFAAHCYEYTIPTLLAAAGLKHKLTGKEFITAYVVGEEVLCRIGKTYRTITKSALGGRRQADGMDLYGSVAAASKLLGFSLDELENAEGIACGMIQSHGIYYRPPTLMVRMHHAFVCHDAIEACLLAKRGITGQRQGVLAGSSGTLGFAESQTDLNILTNRLGEEWEMLKVMMKPYPCCKFSHTSIFGILDQMREHNFKVKDIDRIDFDECPLYEFNFEPREIKWNPQTVPECQFSLPYLVAIAAYDGDVFLNSYTPQARARQDVRELMTRISAKVDPSLSKWGTRIHVTLKDGRRYSGEYRFIKGHYEEGPFTDQELVDRFKKCVPYSAYKLSDDVVDSVTNSILNLETVDDVVSALLLPLTPE